MTTTMMAMTLATMLRMINNAGDDTLLVTQSRLDNSHKVRNFHLISSSFLLQCNSSTE